MVGETSTNYSLGWSDCTGSGSLYCAPLRQLSLIIEVGWLIEFALQYRCLWWARDTYVRSLVVSSPDPTLVFMHVTATWQWSIALVLYFVLSLHRYLTSCWHEYYPHNPIKYKCGCKLQIAVPQPTCKPLYHPLPTNLKLVHEIHSQQYLLDFSYLVWWFPKKKEITTSSWHCFENITVIDFICPSVCASLTEIFTLPGNWLNLGCRWKHLAIYLTTER